MLAAWILHDVETANRSAGAFIAILRLFVLVNVVAVLVELMHKRLAASALTLTILVPACGNGPVLKLDRL